MSTSPKHALYIEFASVARAIGHPHRLEIIEQLAQGERSVDALAERINLSIANASQHLQQLRRVGLVHSRRDGKFVLYRLADDHTALNLVASLRTVAEQNIAEVDKIVRSYFAQRDSMEPVARTELFERIQSGLVTVLDVRPADEFAMSHLPGALNMQLSEIEARVAEFDPTREIVAYCRGPYCVLSYEAVAKLRTRGLKARRLEDGLPEWKAAGLPLDTA